MRQNVGEVAQDQEGDRCFSLPPCAQPSPITALETAAGPAQVLPRTGPAQLLHLLQVTKGLFPLVAAAAV